MQRLLIAHSSEVLRELLSDMFLDVFSVQCCGDGDTAMALLDEFRPDALILECNLPYKDGLTVLQEATHRPAAILGIGTGLNTYTANACAALGMGYLLTAPSADAIRLRLLDLVRRAESRGQTLSLREQTEQHLHALGLSPHLDGYKQLAVGIPLFYEDPAQLLDKELYPRIGEQLGCKSPKTVERNLRHAIQSAWEGRNESVWRKYFPPAANGRIPCPGNKTFIARIARMLRKPDNET